MAASPVVPAVTMCSITARALRSGTAWASIASAASYPKRCPAIAESTKPNRLSTSGTVMVSSASTNSSAPSVAITTGAALCARKIETSLLTSDAVEPRNPAAQTKMNGSEDRSMCFLSSVTSQAIAL